MLEISCMKETSLHPLSFDLSFDFAGNLLTNHCSFQVLRKISIEDSLTKFISLVVQIYLAVLAIANSVRTCQKTMSYC